ncbi:hypothetical protein M9H77_23097 [Catharanthus roseus]|uniref:Uncharacterized protein n=1 Tax=Catharanthus roseus TaxID=4058 RepID=A0ACC0ASC0_CATRO|nr:hypothetical protein M9H77_23097 [Catharanthus roseus]
MRKFGECWDKKYRSSPEKPKASIHKMENQIKLLAKIIVERPLSNVPSNTITLNHGSNIRRMTRREDISWNSKEIARALEENNPYTEQTEELNHTQQKIFHQVRQKPTMDGRLDLPHSDPHIENNVTLSVEGLLTILSERNE